MGSVVIEMKLTASKKQLIEREVAKYKAQMGIEFEIGLWFKSREVLDAPIEVTEGRRTSAYRAYGVCYNKPLNGKIMLFINVRRIPSTADLRDTIIHELAHVRFPSMAHVREFYQIIKKVKNGKQYPTYKGSKWSKRFQNECRTEIQEV